ncbi:hypothetical protein B0H63DRAFT_467448 [Podospora didyma]|uniref:Uncharacterized protein n=1 Tax=Podospora didyma TaxID=330526 RepID=A0AAE0P0U5_9PEZI|nr:hypothetical protein B0H63DRAFT_467448 [Podospora didyma]
MKAAYILAGLAYGLFVEAGLAQPAGLAARQRGSGGGSATCTWTDHCLGDECETENDCDGQLICINSQCANIPTTTARATARPTSTRRATPTPTPTPKPAACEWEGHCLGDTCKTENDCDGQLICRAGKCAPVATTTIVSTRPRTTAPATTTKPAGNVCGANPLACIGVSCKTDADCGFDLIICKEGVCGL